jgi:hypothetical protein
MAPPNGMLLVLSCCRTVIMRQLNFNTNNVTVYGRCIYDERLLLSPRSCAFGLAGGALNAWVGRSHPGMADSESTKCFRFRYLLVFSVSKLTRRKVQWKYACELELNSYGSGMSPVNTQLLPKLYSIQDQISIVPISSFAIFRRQPHSDAARVHFSTD